MNRTAGWDALLGLLRFGELSAAASFGRMLRGRSAHTSDKIVDALAPVAADERKHERWLIDFCERQAVVTLAPPRPVRRFFASLAGGDLAVHLARIAALDGCVCQTLGQVLRPDATRDSTLGHLLQSIRRDEAHHVAVARALARQLGVSHERMVELDGETRHSFARVLEHYRASFDAMAIDTEALTRRIRRHDVA